ncbi:hypothetical protein [Nocardia cyriacigeorgica]|uniref:hypothetical protein n=1 Tax=Nocardia cyriacigeorgica TaxID=135487 RepID=UPI0014864908|nr:hypothetical protein [Nocardia cyriacigeorgica]
MPIRTVLRSRATMPRTRRVDERHPPDWRVLPGRFADHRVDGSSAGITVEA